MRKDLEGVHQRCKVLQNSLELCKRDGVIEVQNVHATWQERLDEERRRAEEEIAMARRIVADDQCARKVCVAEYKEGSARDERDR